MEAMPIWPAILNIIIPMNYQQMSKRLMDAM